MTQSAHAAAGKVPVPLTGQIIAVVWMVASVIVIASFTAALTSQLTLGQLRLKVHREAALPYVRVAAIAGIETTEYLGRRHIAHKVFADAEAGLSALQKGRIDAWSMPDLCCCGWSTRAFPARCRCWTRPSIRRSM
jgi:polar amino acid transport system substrate-binding protein